MQEISLKIVYNFVNKLSKIYFMPYSIESSSSFYLLHGDILRNFLIFIIMRTSIVLMQEWVLPEDSSSLDKIQ